MKSNIIFILSSILLLFSCYDDKGNYEYKELETIHIGDVDSNYICIFKRDRLQIKPSIKSSANANIKYLWCFESSKDTISTSSSLDTLVTWEPGKYRIILKVENAKTGYAVHKRIYLDVNTEYSVGWYVLKDDGEYTDLDLYADGYQVNDVIKTMNKTSIRGKGKQLSFFGDHDVFEPNENTYKSRKVLFAVTDKEVHGIDIMTAHRWRTFDDLFFEVPSNCKPDAMFQGIHESYFINDGKIYPLGLSSQTNGKFMSVRSLNGDYHKYNLSKYCCTHGFAMNLLVYDEESSTFYTASARQGQMTKLSNGSSYDMSCASTGKKLLYMGNRSTISSTNLIAVFQDKDNPDLKMISTLNPTTSTFITKLAISNDTLDNDDPAYNAERYTLSHSEDVLYFVSGNKLYSRNMGGSGKNGASIEEFSIPEGETTTFIRSINLSTPCYNYLILGTEINGTYKIRFFAKTTAGHLNPNPIMELPRKNEVANGRASDIIYINPNLSPLSYPMTW